MKPTFRWKTLLYARMENDGFHRNSFYPLEWLWSHVFIVSSKNVSRLFSDWWIWNFEESSVAMGYIKLHEFVSSSLPCWWGIARSRPSCWPLRCDLADASGPTATAPHMPGRVRPLDWRRGPGRCRWSCGTWKSPSSKPRRWRSCPRSDLIPKSSSWSRSCRFFHRKWRKLFTRLAKVGDGLVVDREIADRSSVFGAHVADGCPVSDWQFRHARAEKLDELAHHSNLRNGDQFQAAQ